MQINNITDNRVLRFKNLNKTVATFLIFENDTEQHNSDSIEIEVGEDPTKLYDNALLYLGENYQLVENNINWLFVDRPIRFIINKKWNTDEAAENSSIGLLIASLISDLSPFTTKNRKAENIITYLPQVLESHKEIANPFVISGEIKVHQLINNKVILITDLYQL